MTVLFYDPKALLPESFPKHVSEFTNEIQTECKGKTTTWHTFPKVFLDKESNDAVLAINGASTVFALLVKEPDGIWEVSVKMKAFGRSFQWLTMMLGNQLDPSST